MSERRKAGKRYVYLSERMARWDWWLDLLYVLGFPAIVAFAVTLASDEGLWSALVKALDRIG